MRDLLFEALKQYAIDNSRRLETNGLQIDFLGIFPHALLSPNRSQIFIGPFVLVQLAAGTEGVCFPEGELDIASSFQFVGDTAISVLDKAPLEVQIALIDAVFGYLNRYEEYTPNEVIEFLGHPDEKALKRAYYIASLISATEKDKVGVIGCIEPMIQALLETGSDIRIADLHSIHPFICGIPVEKDALAIVDWADKLIVTGGALWTETLGLILSRSYSRRVLTLVYAMTGHNIAPRYLKYGADIVTVEYFPFYWFVNTTSKLEVYRKI